MSTLNDFHKSAAKALATSQHAFLHKSPPEAQATAAINATTKIALYTINALLQDPALQNERARLFQAMLYAEEKGTIHPPENPDSQTDPPPP